MMACCKPLPEVMDRSTSAIPNAVATILNFSSGPITLEPVLFCIFLAMKNASFISSQFRTTLALFAVLLLCFSARGQESYASGIAQTGAYYMKLTEKSVAVVANATSLLPNGTHTVDHLISLSVDVQQVWAPEHEIGRAHV